MVDKVIDNSNVTVPYPPEMSENKSTHDTYKKSNEMVADTSINGLEIAPQEHLWNFLLESEKDNQNVSLNGKINAFLRTNIN